MDLGPFTNDDSNFESAVRGMMHSDRLESEKDKLWDFDDSPLEENDVNQTSGRYGQGFKKSGNLDDEEFDAFKDPLSDSQAFEYRSGGNLWSAEENSDELQTPNPSKVSNSRSKEAIRQDRRKKAPVTTDPEKYASNPDRYDYPFVDTPPEFTEKYADQVFSSWDVKTDKIDKDAGKDDVIERY